MGMPAGQIIDSISIASLLVASMLIIYVLAKYYKGMKTPPFWIYIASGFLFLTFVSVLNTFSMNVDEMVLSVINLVGHLLFLVGAVSLFKSYSSRIKFDKKSSG